MRRGSETVIRLRPERPGRFGDPTGEPSRKAITGCEMLPRSSTEASGNANTVTVGMTLVAPPGTDLKATDRIEHKGLEYTVEGDVARYRKGGREVAVTAALERVTG